MCVCVRGGGGGGGGGGWALGSWNKCVGGQFGTSGERGGGCTCSICPNSVILMIVL